jgi:hypothetical protein
VNDHRLTLDLDAFLQEHRRCGELNGGVQHDRVWMTCECGAMLAGLPDTIDPRGPKGK